MENITVLRTSSKNIDFINLVKLLDQDLAIRDGEDHSFYHQFNQIVNLKNCVVLYNNDKAVGCGAIKPYDDETMEVKRMFVLESERGKGLASKILKALESWCQELGFSKSILETGIHQPEAIALYHKNKYKIIENYGQYKGVETSVCFSKSLLINAISL